MAVVGLIALTAFVDRQRASASPLIDFALFRNAQFTAGVVAALVASAALIGVELVFGQRLQRVLGLAPLEAELMDHADPVRIPPGGPLTGLALPRLGAARMLSGAPALTGMALLVYLVTHQGPPASWLAVMGVGVGATMTAASSVIILSAPEDRAGMAASIEEVSFELGGALGIAVLGSVMSALYSRVMTVPVGPSDTITDSLDEALPHS